MPDSFWSGRRVFVTGATGLLGGWMVDDLLRRGADVIALVRDEVRNSLFTIAGLDKGTTVVRGDLADACLLRRILAEFEVQTVLHLAAQAIVGTAKIDPVGTLETNVRGTWNLLDAIRLTRTVSACVVASSDKAYGIPQSLPYSEDHPLRGVYPYDVSKSCTDLVCRMYAATYGLPIAITRCGNLYGGGDLNFSRMIPGLIRATLASQRFLIRSDGLFVRDYLYAKDAVKGYLTLAELLTCRPELHGEAFNFSIEVHPTVLDVVNLVLRLMHAEDLTPIVQNIASAEIRQQYLSAAKAHSQLGWRPSYTLESGLRETIDWYSKHLAKGKGAALADLG
jgi:CDP-glucose 4,6-dehydratase